MDLAALPEPYLGALDRPVGVFLDLHPGQAHLDFQGRSGRFADEIRHHGSYSGWAATWPYLRDPWVAAKGHHPLPHLPPELPGDLDQPPNPDRRRHGRLRAVPLAHRHGWPAACGPTLGIVREFIWQPVRELDAPVFAFGKPWFDLLEHGFGLQVVDRLGAGGRPYATEVASRPVLVLRDQDGPVVVAEKHQGGAGPPRRSETLVLREAVEPWLGES